MCVCVCVRACVFAPADHITAIMELIENALEALLTGDPHNNSLAKVEISFDNTTNSISIKDNGCGRITIACQQCGHAEFDIHAYNSCTHMCMDGYIHVCIACTRLFKYAYRPRRNDGGT